MAVDDNDILENEDVSFRDDEFSAILQNGTNLNHNEETPVNSNLDRNNGSLSVPLPRRVLEERFTSRIGQVLKESFRRNNSIEEVVEVVPTYTTSADDLAHVARLKAVSNTIGSTGVLYRYGGICALAIGEYMALGTEKGYIIIFDSVNSSHREIYSRTSLECGSITSLAFSADSTYLAAGYVNGSIFLWDIEKPGSPVFMIPGLTQNDLAKGYKEGHLAGSKIHQINFVGKRHTALVSADNSGLFCYHNGYRNLLGYHVISRKILGKYSYEAMSFSPILSAGLLPLGTSREVTDSIGLTAIMTPHAMIAISLYPKLQTHFKIGKPSAVAKVLPITACLAWLPALIAKDDQDSPSCPKLCYCFSNVLTVFDVYNEIMTTKETDEENVFVKFTNKKRWVGTECIVAVQWLNDRIIALLTNGHRLLLLNDSTMQLVATIDLLGKDVNSSDMFSDPVFNLSYTSSFKALKNKIFFIGGSNVFAVTLSNWADLLMTMIEKGEYLEALTQCRRFYSGSVDDVAVYGLPSAVKKRKDLLYENTLQLIHATLEFVCKDASQNDTESSKPLREFSKTLFQIYIDYNGQISMETLELVYEKFSSNNIQSIFFSELKEFIKTEKISHLSPEILKALVSHFVETDRGPELEQLICLLDMSTLDIDLTVSLCKEHHLLDCLVYTWNTALSDYITPFFDFIQLIIEHKALADNDEKKKSIKKDASKVFAYISYILTGRQYPTERLIGFEKVRTAKAGLYYVIFSGASLAWPRGIGSKIHITQNISLEPAFPYLYLLLKFNMFETLAALNEAFEDDFLNHDNSDSLEAKTPFAMSATRQYIIDVLFDVLRSNSQEFSEIDTTYLAIFVARNYPKFKQFITLSDSTCEDLIESLCSYSTPDMKEDCELSLQSLLSVFHPLNMSDLIYFFERAGFYDVLFSVYKSEQKFHKVLEIWNLNKKRDQLEDEVLHKKGYIDHKDLEVVIKCFELTKNNASEREEIESFIRHNFERLVSYDMQQMIRVFSKYEPSFHEEAVSGPYNKAFVLEYFTVFFDQANTKGISDDQLNAMRVKYIDLLAEFDLDKLYRFLKTSNFNEIPIPAIMPALKEHKATRSIVFLLERSGQYIDCVEEIVSAFRAHQEEIIKILKHENDYTQFDMIETELWEYLFLAIKMCDQNIKETLRHNNLTGKEWLWLSIVKVTVEMLKAVNAELNDGNPRNKKETYISNTIKRLVQDCFTNLIDSSSISEQSEDSSMNDATNLSFFAVFNEFLNESSSSSEEQTRLSHVRLVLDEVFVSYKYDMNIQKIILSLVSARIFRDFEFVNGMRARGLTSQNSECDACGKVLWGAKIPNDFYDAWKAYQLDGASVRVFSGDSLGEESAISLYDCGHSFHDHCLERLTGNRKKSCLICDA